MTYKIDSALIQAFDDGAFGLDYAVENKSFVPVVGTPYAEVYILHAQPFVNTMGDGGEDLVSGIMQINLNYPVNTGVGAANQKVTEIRNVFKAGFRPSYLGQEVFITSAGKGPSGNIDSFYQIIVNINWEARVQR